MNLRMVRRHWPRAILMALVVLAVISIPELLPACPNCKDTLAQNDPARSGLALGFFWSILLMLGTPFLVTAGLGTYFYLLIRKARLAAAAKGATSSPVRHDRKRELTNA